MVTGLHPFYRDDESRASGDGLTVSVDRGTRHDRLVVSMAGELDMFNAQCLFDAVSGLELDGHRTVVLDLTGLRFCDAGGVSAVLRADRLLRDRGGRLMVHGISGLPRRVFTLTGIDRVLELE